MEKRDTPVEVKVCSRCSHKKLNTEFYRDASKPDGLQVLPHALPHTACRLHGDDGTSQHPSFVMNCISLSLSLSLASRLLGDWHPRPLKH